MMKLPGITRLALAAAPLLLSSVAFGAPAGGDIVTLQTFMVAVSQNDPWQYAATPGFEILSRCPASFTERYVRALQRSVAAKYAILPRDFWADMRSPMKIILYNKEPSAGNISSSDIDLVAAPMDGTNWGSLSVLRSKPMEAGDGDTFMNCGNYWGLLQGGGEAVDLEAEDAFSVDPDGKIRLAAHTPRFPAWFEVGMDGPFGVCRSSLVRKRWNDEPVAILPMAIWVSRERTAALKRHPDHPSRVLSPPDVMHSVNEVESREATWDSDAYVETAVLLPLQDLFSGRGKERHEAIWKSEAALFDRWGLFGADAQGRGYRAAFIKFVRRAMKEPVTEPMFRECFGLRYAEVENRLVVYLPQALRSTLDVPLGDVTSGSVDIRDATKGEVARIVGDWTRFEGYSLKMSERGLSQEYLDHAARLFERTYDGGARDPQFLAAMGLWAVQSDDSRAHALLEAATAAGVIRPKAYLELARLRLQDALPYPASGIGDLTADDSAAILKLLAVARRQMPSLLEAHELTAEVLEHAPVMPTRAELEVLDDSLRVFPRQASLVVSVAHLYRRSGFSHQATAIIARGTAFAETDADRALLAAAPQK